MTRELDELLALAEAADGSARIGFRDQIAAFGDEGVERLGPWLRDPRLAPFAVRTIERAATEHGATSAERILRAGRADADTWTKADIDRVLALLRPPRSARTSTPTSGSTDRAIGQLRAAVDEWQRRGRPAQPPIRWPRERWLAELPEHHTLLRSLPAQLDRVAVAAVGRTAAESPTRAVEALVAVMAWGHGIRGYAQHRAREILAAPGLDALLHGVARATVDNGALAGYRRLATIGRVGLGPSFGTKFLYFVQPVEARPRALIHDRVIAGWLIDVAGLPLRHDPYADHRYAAYLDVMHAWSHEPGCMPDEVEMCIFRAIQPPGSQWA